MDVKKTIAVGCIYNTKKGHEVKIMVRNGEYYTGSDGIVRGADGQCIYPKYNNDRFNLEI